MNRVAAVCFGAWCRELGGQAATGSPMIQLALMNAPRRIRRQPILELARAPSGTVARGMALSGRRAKAPISDVAALLLMAFTVTLIARPAPTSAIPASTSQASCPEPSAIERPQFPRGAIPAAKAALGAGAVSSK